MAGSSYYFTSESVTEGHSDKVCDQVCDAVLDAILAEEARLEAAGYVSPAGVPARLASARCACEALVTADTLVVAGELRAQARVDVERIARETLRQIGYDSAQVGFDCDACTVVDLTQGQSPDIARGVDDSPGAGDPLDALGAGDQGMMFGYATDETASLMPQPIWLAHRLAERLAAVRRDGSLAYLRPDGKTQVTLRYEGGLPREVTCVVVSCQHAPEVDDMAAIRADVIEQVIAPVMAAEGVAWEAAEIYVNPTGRFVVGGPAGDTGLTGRKVIVDSYGGMGRHGGGAFSGKDPTKVDRSGAYAARWVAKNVVAAGLARRCEVELAYAIGLARPLSVLVDTQGTGVCDDRLIERAVGEVFDLRPAALIRDLGLLRPIYGKTAVYGHFGREDPDFGWERTDRVDELRAALSR